VLTGEQTTDFGEHGETADTGVEDADGSIGGRFRRLLRFVQRDLLQGAVLLIFGLAQS
jgi:hypothetical protein